MEAVVLVVLAVVGFVVYLNIRARSIVRRHSRTLAARTGIPVHQIEQEMARHRLTPGEWAARHGLDPLTFQPRERSSQKVQATPSLGRASGERDLPDPNWEEIEDRFARGEQPLDACKGWRIGEGIDDPCAVYLTNWTVHIDVRPDTLQPREVVSIPLWTIHKCGVGPSDLGTPRLVIGADPGGSGNPSDIVAVGIDLRPEDRGWEFSKRVTTQIEIAKLQMQYAYLNAELAPLLAEAQEKASIREALEELGAEPDPELNARIKRELGIPDTPFNT